MINESPLILDRIKQCQDHMVEALTRFLPPQNSPFAKSMHYACLNGGKRLRPLLVFSTAEIFEMAWEELDPLACAIEFIHCYSLIHDDLPCMDNDDLRRGLPTCHKAFGEAAAVLAGDGLLTLAFEVLSSQPFPTISESTVLKMIQILSRASGTPHGMVQGQAIDIESQGKRLSFEELTQLHLLKTGALITASVQCAALATGRASEGDLDKLQKFGQSIGLAFQIQDDILDHLGNRENMGKEPGKDVKNQKSTFVTLLGIARAREHALAAHQKALGYLDHFKHNAHSLRSLSQFIIDRVS